MTADTPVHDNAERHRWETRVDGHLAQLTYEIDGDVIAYTHTIVPDAIGGRGIAGALVKAAIADARARGLKVVPKCSYVEAWFEKHPDQRDLLA